MLLRIPAVAGLLAGGLWVASASPASATIPHYTGAAPGGITCTSMSLHIKFLSPDFMNLGGGGVAGQIIGHANGCTPWTSDGVTILSGKVTGSFSGPPAACEAGPPQGLQPAPATFSLTIQWRGQYNGSVGIANDMGAAHFNPTVITYNSDAVGFSSELTTSGTYVGFNLAAADSALSGGSSFDGYGTQVGDPPSSQGTGQASGSLSTVLPADAMTVLNAQCRDHAEGGHGLGIHGFMFNSGSISIGPTG